MRARSVARGAAPSARAPSYFLLELAGAAGGLSAVFFSSAALLLRCSDSSADDDSSRRGRLIFFPLPAGNERGRSLDVGDLNGDGKADLLWRHVTDGALHAWFMNGPGTVGSGPLGTVPFNWDVVGLGDFDGNGKADILWREAASGATYLWFMNGITVVAQGFTAAQTDSHWQVVHPR